MVDFHPSLNNAVKLCRHHWGIGKVSLYPRIAEPAGGTTILFSLLLHQLPWGEGMKLLQDLIHNGIPVLMADYKLPERNLDYPSYWLSRIMESLGTHPERYTDFMRCGGIEGIIRSLGVVPQRRGVLWGGSISIVWIDGRGET